MRPERGDPRQPGGGGGGAGGEARPSPTSILRRLAGDGLAIVPCEPGGKAPLACLVPRGLADATTDWATIEGWLHDAPGCNWAVRTGPIETGPWAGCHLAILDIDDAQVAAAVLERTRVRGLTTITLTPRGGVHIWAMTREPVYTGKVLAPDGSPLGDVKATSRGGGPGGYALIYGWTERGSYALHWGPGAILVDDAAAWFEGLLAAAGIQASIGRVALPREEGATEGVIRQGQRNNTLTAIAGSLRARGLDSEAIYEALAVINSQRCRPPLPEAEVRRIAYGMERYPPRPNLPNNGHAPHKALADTVPAIYITPGSYDLAKAVDEAWEALLAANRPPRLFRQGDAVVEVEAGEVRVVGMGRMRELLARAASWLRPTPHGPLPVPPPEAVAQALLERPHQDLPVLRGVVRSPILTEEGIIVTPGYDAATGLYYAPGPGLEGMPPVPDQPAAEDVAEAKRLLLEELLGDFPFDSQASRAAAMAMLLTPFLRELIDGLTPLFLVDKPTPGAGATLLATVAATVATGEPPSYLSPREGEEEWRKAATSVLLQGAGLVLIDNVKALSSATLSSAITAAVWSDRLLGRNSIITLPNRALWVATGNNPTLSLELARRCVRVRLEPPSERPWTRTGFRHPHLLRWVRENRGRLVWACLVLARHWLAHGRPSPSCPRPGMFEAWAETVGGVLEAAGIQGFLENTLEVYEEAEASPFLERARGLLTLWWQRFGEREVTAGQLLEAAQQEGLEEEPAGKREKDRQARRLGTLLRQLRGRVFDLPEATVRVTKTGVDRTRQGHWRLVRLGDPQGAQNMQNMQNVQNVLRPMLGNERGGATGQTTFCTFCTFSSPAGGAAAGAPPPDDDDPWAAFEPEEDGPPAQEVGPPPQEPPHPPQPCPRCRPAGMPGYYACERGQEVTLLRVGIERERHVLRSRQAICFNFGLLRAIEPDFLVVSFSDGSWGWVTLATAKKLGHEGEFGAERQLAVPLGAFNWEAAQGVLAQTPDKTPDMWAENLGQNPGQNSGHRETPDTETPDTETPDKRAKNSGQKTPDKTSDTGGQNSGHGETPDTKTPDIKTSDMPRQNSGQGETPDNLCRACGKPLEKPRRGPPPRWCSEACRKRARGRGGEGRWLS